MKDLEITGQETADELLKMLAHLRLWEIILHKKKATVTSVRANLQTRLNSPLDRVQRASDEDQLERVDEWLLNRKFSEIACGRFLMTLCKEIDRKGVPREAVFDVINTNPADRTHPDVMEYGDSTVSLIAVLNLENSASCRGDDWSSPAMQPLAWCCQMAMRQAMKTHPQFDRAVHDEVSKVFGGAFGEYREPSLMSRLSGGTA